MAIKVGRVDYESAGDVPRYKVSCENGFIVFSFVADDEDKAKMYMTPDVACELSDVLIRWAAYVRARVEPKKRAS